MKTVYFKDIKPSVCLLVILFGMGSWIAVNGVWVELPVLVHQLPEGWNLPSYMTVIIQVANLGPLLYTIGHLWLPRIVTEKPAAYFIIGLGCLSSILMAFLWEKTSEIGDTNHAIYFFVLLFCLSVTDCTSSVVFLPFMNHFKPQYMTSYYIGGGFSGLVPSIVSFAQGVGETECVNVSLRSRDGTNDTDYGLKEVYLPPLFPARDFFFFIFAMMIVCAAAFVALNYLPYCRKEYVEKSANADDEKNPNKEAMHADGPMVVTEEDVFVEKKSLYSEVSEEKSYQDQNCIETENMVQPSKPIMSTTTYLIYLVYIGWVNAMTNGVLIAVQSFACLPYGDQTYHLSVTLCNIINPIACFAAFFVTVRSTLTISVMTIVGSIISCYILVVSIYSPEPPLLHSVLGPIAIVLAYVLVYMLFTYVKVNIATLFHMRGKRALLWCGVVTQIGSTTGSVLMFVTVNVYNLFIQNYACS